METPIAAPPSYTNRIFELRPMSIGDLLDRVVYFYRNHFGAVLLYSTILNIPATVFLFATSVLGSLPLLAPDMIAENPGLLFSSNLLVLAASLAFSLVSGFTTAFQVAGMAAAVKDFLLEGKRSSIGDMWAAVRAKLSKVVALVFVLILFGLIVFIPSIILLFTVIGTPFALAIITLFSFAMTLAYSIVMYEERDAVEALRRGWLLISAGGRRVLALFVLYYIFSLIIGVLIGGVLGIAGGIGMGLTENPLFFTAVQPIAQLLILILVNPLLYATTSMLYFDLRVRSEGLDVALMAQTAAGESYNLTAAPVTQETVFGEGPRRAILTLAGIYTLVIVVACGLIGGLVFLAGAISSL
jgi:hypothetical protein